MITNVLKYANNYLDSLSTYRCLFIMLMISILLGILDYLIGPELPFSVFYTISIMLAVRYGGKSAGLIVAIFSAGIWISVDLAALFDSSFSTPK